MSSSKRQEFQAGADGFDCELIQNGKHEADGAASYLLPKEKLPYIITDVDSPNTTQITTPASISEERALLTSGDPPGDRYKMVYLILLLHGVGVLMPWNMFITAQDYFVKHKLGGPSTEYGKNYLSYTGICAQVPNVLLNLLNLSIQFGCTLTKRVVWSIIVIALVFCFTILLAMLDTSSWDPAWFFVLTMISVVIVTSASGVYQNSIFGIAADLPLGYSNSIVLGNNISGVFTSVIAIVAIAVAPDLKTSAIYYFIAALFMLLLCFDTYFALPQCKFYRYYTNLAAQNKLASTTDANHSTSRGFRTALRPYIQVFRKAWPQFFSVFLVFFVSLTIFPAIEAGIAPSDEAFVTETFAKEYYTPVTCFLVFNVFAMLGSLIANWVRFPGPRFLWVPVVARILMIPYFAMCNYRPMLRTFPVYIGNDWAYIFMAALMAISSGYLSSLAMIYAPKVVEPAQAGIAGMMAAVFLILGIALGLQFTLFVAFVVEKLGPLAAVSANSTMATTTIAL